MKRKHPETFKSGREESQESCDVHNDNTISESSVCSSSGASNTENATTVTDKQKLHQRALFLLKAKEIHKMSELALSDVMTDFTVMIDDILDDVYEDVEKKLKLHDISTGDIGLNEVFNNVKYKEPFSGLHSEYLRTKYFADHMQLVVYEFIVY